MSVTGQPHWPVPKGASERMKNLIKQEVAAEEDPVITRGENGIGHRRQQFGQILNRNV